MAKCRNCDRSGLTVRSDKRGLCRACSTDIEQDVDCKLGEVKEALVYIRCSTDPEVQESFCDVAIDTVLKLAAYEKRRYAEIRPSPAAMLAMLRTKREEAVAARPHLPEVVRPATGASAVLSQIHEPFPKSGETTPAVPDRTVSQREQEWWAWAPPASAEGSASDPGAEGPECQREEGRVPASCLALLNPGAVRGSLQNISPGGIFLQTEKLHPPGQPVNLIISTATGPAKAQGVVRWVQADSMSGLEPGMGIEFTEVAEELLSYLSTRLVCSLAVAGPPAHGVSQGG